MLAAAMLLGALALPNHSSAQGPEVQSATVVSGISIHKSFYDDLRDDLSASLSERTGTFLAGDIHLHMDKIQEGFDFLDSWLEDAYDDAMAWIEQNAEWLYDIVQGIFELFGLGCDLDEGRVDLIVPDASILTYYTFATDPIVLNPITNTTQSFVLSVAEAGVLAELEILAYIGEPDGLCSDREKRDMKFYYKNLQFQGTITFLPGGDVSVVVTPPATLGVVQRELESTSLASANTVFALGNVVINGKNLTQRLADFTNIEVSQSLKVCLEQYWRPYLSRTGSRMNLNGARQNARFTANGVVGPVANAVYQKIVGNVSQSKLQTVLSNAHSAISSIDQGTCEEDGTFTPGSNLVTPNFQAETADAEGTFHTSVKNFEHVILGAIQSGVGWRNETKSGSPYTVEYSFDRLVPEVGPLSPDNVTTLLHPNPPTYIPVIGSTLTISAAQRDALVARTAPAGTLGAEFLTNLRLRVRVCEHEKHVDWNAYGDDTIEPTIRHDIVLRATIESGTTTVLTQDFDAVFLGNLLLSKTPRQDSTELRSIGTKLVSLVTNGGTLDWDDVIGTTPFNSAQVTIFLRAFFGDPTIAVNASDSRVYYLLDGLMSPLVERSAHGVVVLPGCDFGVFDGPVLALEPTAPTYYGSDYQLGFDFNRDMLCATVIQFGRTDGLVSGVPSSANRMLTMQLAWTKKGLPNEGIQMKTTVGVTAVAGTLPLTVTNPSRNDEGFISTVYTPVTADESRVIDMSGRRFGAYLPGGGRHLSAATPAGFAKLRQITTADPVTYAKASLELQPYKGYLGTPAPCSSIWPGPVAFNGAGGAHHEEDVLDYYQAMLFESRLSCEGPGLCDGTRVVALWMAPLFTQCTPKFKKDQFTFDTVEGSIRNPPTGYDYTVEAGCASVGGGPGNYGEGELED
ncbi:MAG: hypothetical protein ACKVWV_16355 [Planctomycetota bacterium]